MQSYRLGTPGCKDSQAQMYRIACTRWVMSTKKQARSDTCIVGKHPASILVFLGIFQAEQKTEKKLRSGGQLNIYWQLIQKQYYYNYYILITCVAYYVLRRKQRVFSCNVLAGESSLK
jgi:hypothetical protein